MPQALSGLGHSLVAGSATRLGTSPVGRPHLLECPEPATGCQPPFGPACSAARSFASNSPRRRPSETTANRGSGCTRRARSAARVSALRARAAVMSPATSTSSTNVGDAAPRRVSTTSAWGRRPSPAAAGSRSSRPNPRRALPPARRNKLADRRDRSAAGTQTWKPRRRPSAATMVCHSGWVKAESPAPPNSRADAGAAASHVRWAHPRYSPRSRPVSTSVRSPWRPIRTRSLIG